MHLDRWIGFGYVQRFEFNGVAISVTTINADAFASAAGVVVVAAVNFIIVIVILIVRLSLMAPFCELSDAHTHIHTQMSVKTIALQKLKNA